MPDSLRKKRASEKENIAFAKEMLGQGKTQKAPSVKKDGKPEEVEITAAVSRKTFEEAGGDIKKIFNNTPADIFCTEESDMPKEKEQNRSDAAAKEEKQKAEKKIQTARSAAGKTGVLPDTTRSFENTGTLGSIMSNANVQITKIPKMPLKVDKLKKKLEDRQAQAKTEETSAEERKVSSSKSAYYEPDFMDSDRSDEDSFETGRVIAGENPEEDDDTATAVLEDPFADAKKDCPKLISMTSGEEFKIGKPVFTVGHSVRCDLQIKQPGPTHTVSRQHATFYLKNGDVYLVDQSTNGTFIGNSPENPEDFIRMMKDQEMQVKDGQYLLFANVMFKFEKGKDA